LLKKVILNAVTDIIETHTQPINIQNPYSTGRNPYISETRF